MSQRKEMTAFYTMDDVAVMMSVSVDNVKMSITRRELACYKFGRLVRIKREDLEAFWAKARRVSK